MRQTCSFCGEEIPEDNKFHNFCTRCSAKLNPTCEKCWVVNAPFNCGEEPCPAYSGSAKVIKKYNEYKRGLK